VAGARNWTLAPPLIALAVAALAIRPRVVRSATRVLDVSLLVCLAAVVFAVVPVPAGWRHALSPSADHIAGAIRFGGIDPSAARPTSLDPVATARSIVVTLLTLGVFWIGRDVAAMGGRRRILRFVAGAGFVVSTLAVVVKGTVSEHSHLVLGIFDPTDAAATPYGPFLNRNHMGTWLILAIPMTLGYMVARVRRLRRSQRSVVDAAMLWLAGSAAMMFVALIVSTSRSAMIGLVVTAATGIVLAAGKTGNGATRGRAVLAACGLAGAAIAFALLIPRTTLLLARFDVLLTGDPTAGRMPIWRETLPMIRDFALTGVGGGAYPAGMLIYQQSSREFFFNQAHNHYLQIMAEGGLIVAVPLLVAAMAFAVVAARRLKADMSATYWIRAGAVAGIAGVLVQSLWEIGISSAANALLFAAACALAVSDEQYRRPVSSGRRRRRRSSSHGHDEVPWISS
jgi:O-antigen ligase